MVATLTCGVAQEVEPRTPTIVSIRAESGSAGTSGDGAERGARTLDDEPGPQQLVFYEAVGGAVAEAEHECGTRVGLACARDVCAWAGGAEPIWRPWTRRPSLLFQELLASQLDTSSPCARATASLRPQYTRADPTGIRCLAMSRHDHGKDAAVIREMVDAACARAVEEVRD